MDCEELSDCDEPSEVVEAWLDVLSGSSTEELELVIVLVECEELSECDELSEVAEAWLELLSGSAEVELSDCDEL